MHEPVYTHINIKESKTEFEQLITSLNTSAKSNDVFNQITFILKEQTDHSCVLFISQFLKPLLILEQWAWHKLSEQPLGYMDRTYYWDLLYVLGLFNKKIVFSGEQIEDNIKFSLLIPQSLSLIDLIFEQCKSDDEQFITLVNLWFDNISFLVQECHQSSLSPIIIYINQFFASHLLMSDLYRYYLTQLQQTSPTFTAKQIFYLKTCSFSLCVFLNTKPKNFPLTTDEILENIGKHYLQIMYIHSYNINVWSKELLTCITHLTGLISICYNYNTKTEELNKILFPIEQILFDYIEALIKIVSYEPFYQDLKITRSEDEAILLDVVLLFLLNILQTQCINWYFQSMTQLCDVLLLRIKDKSIPFQYLFYMYSILGELLNEEQLKELKFTDDMGNLYFDMLEQAWKNSSKTYKCLSITIILRGKYYIRHS